MSVVKEEGAKTTSGHISASYVNLLFEWLDADHPAMVRRCPFKRPDSGELNRVSVQSWAAMLDWTFEQVKDLAFPFKVAEMVKASNMGLLGYIAMCSANLGEAFARLQQFEHLIYAVNDLSVELNDQTVMLCWGQEQGRPGHWVDSLAIAVLVAYTRQLTNQEIRPESVSFINARPDNYSDFQDYFVCPVQFQARQTRVIFRAEVLQTPMRTPDPVMQKILDEQATLLLSQLEQSPTQSRIFLNTLGQAIAAGDPSLSAVAHKLCVSERTLQRQLAQQGTSFRDQLDYARAEIAKTLLSTNNMSLSDIAAYLAYNDQSAFTHAFRRQMGITPAAYRKSARLNAH